MKITLENTSSIVNFNGVAARVWEGHDEHGTRVVAFVARIAVDKREPTEAHERFERELRETAAPRAGDAWPIHMMIDDDDDMLLEHQKEMLDDDDDDDDSDAHDAEGV